MNIRDTPSDGARIDLGDDFALTFWKSRFECNASLLLEAIESVGVDAIEIERYIRLKQSH